MCLLSVGLETLGLLLRVWLWITVPMAVIILIVSTWMNYMRTVRPKGNMKLAVEGFAVEDSPGGGDVYIRRDDLAGEGGALAVDGEAAFAEASAAEAGEEELSATEAGEEELSATGRETIYQGILWMKEKFEQYREEADRRYENLRDELRRSERRYQELLETMEKDKNSAPGAVTDHPQELVEVRGQLDAKQGIIEKMESQLRSERMKVEELVAILQANTRMLQKVIPELGK
jgi:hypothetical protein